ncbi:ribonuclease P protein component [Stappia sp. F7233]|uniref:Ribonuclease P protein component n=1 Tax=Stappia albiluteola TaxID=2758565 RepID=A0A839A9I2_9HYPH|nr:ribonuclease P protein component [Stappia albiluteola]
MPVLKKRSEFLAVQKGGRQHRRAFVLQSLVRGSAADAVAAEVPAGATRARAGHAPQARVGYTVTKKVGNAVVRNRIKRRLRAAMAKVGDCARPGTDYVIVGRQSALTQKFTDLATDLAQCLRQAGSKAEGKGRSGKPRGPRRPAKARDDQRRSDR